MENNEQPTEGLEPCPFCGGKAKRHTISEDDEPSNAGGDVITCQKCYASSHVEFGRKENLVDWWNNRAPQRPVRDVEKINAALVETLRNISCGDYPNSAHGHAAEDYARNALAAIGDDKGTT